MLLRSRVPRAADADRFGHASRLTILLALPLLMAGCSSRPTEAPRADMAPYGGSYSQQVASTAGSRSDDRGEDMEGDGLPAQRPPPVRKRAYPDDPSEPFSPNYGSTAAAADAPATRPTVAATRASYRVETRSGLGQRTAVSGWRTGVVEDRRAADIPNDLPPAFRKRLVEAVNQR